MGKRNTGALEDKSAFVDAVVAALIEHGGGRYDSLKESPVRYKDKGRSVEIVYIDANPGQEWGARNVSGCSLLAMLPEIYKLLA